MPLSHKRDRERKSKLHRLKVKYIMSSADVRAQRAAGLDPEDVGDEASMVSAANFYALLRDRDAIKAHLEWHHQAVKYPDAGTTLEKLRAEVDLQATRITMLEAGLTVHEAQEVYQDGLEAKKQAGLTSGNRLASLLLGCNTRLTV